MKRGSRRSLLLSSTTPTTTSFSCSVSSSSSSSALRLTNSHGFNYSSAAAGFIRHFNNCATRSSSSISTATIKSSTTRSCLLLPLRTTSQRVNSLLLSSERGYAAKRKSLFTPHEWEDVRQRIREDVYSRRYAGDPTVKPGRRISNWFMIFPIITFGLGTWQIYRRAWKKSLLEKRDKRMNAAPAALPDNLTALARGDYEFFRVTTTGEYLYDKEMLVGPRPFEEHSGFIVVTPFKRASDGAVLLVNRGWIRAESLPTEKPAGPVQITAYIRKGETARPFIPENHPELDQWRWLDLEAMGKAMGFTGTPLLLEVAEHEDHPRTQYPKPWNTFLNYADNHLIYVVTWYALTVCLLYLINHARRRAIPPALLEKVRQDVKK